MYHPCLDFGLILYGMFNPRQFCATSARSARYEVSEATSSGVAAGRRYVGRSYNRSMLMLYSDILHACFSAACIRISLVRIFLAFHSGLAALRYLLIVLNYSGYSEANKCQKKDKPYKTWRIAVLLYTEYDSPDSMLIITSTISAINLTASRISTRSLDPEMHTKPASNMLSSET